MRSGAGSAAIWWLLSLSAMLAIWLVAAAFSDPQVLPGPARVAAVIASEAATGELFRHVGVTLFRVVLAFVIAMAAGIGIGLVMGLSRTADRFLDLWLVFFLNLPALVVIILAYVWLGLTETAAVLAVAVNKIPNVVVTVREGVRALDRDLDEVARVYRLSWQSRLVHLIVPQLAPYLAAATRSGIALIWKIVLVVELLGRGDGVGFKLHLHFQLFEIDAILAYALSFIAVMQLIEWLVLRPMERRANRWRQA
ncbi:MAG: ABC transporter permease [Minwuia sp.]|uniref:ABC transporter permease n=1 Tax=Minwuia sp. TaxID=2493630 RepID=UPI003A8A960E